MAGETSTREMPITQRQKVVALHRETGTVEALGPKAGSFMLVLAAAALMALGSAVVETRRAAIPLD